MTIHLYTLCWNEMDILPFVIDYWKKLPIEKAVVYDNGSTDGSIEYLKQFDWIEIRHFETEGMNDAVQRDIKNSCWKESIGKCDFVVVCDMDEILYSKNIEKELQDMKDNGYSICTPKWYDFISEERPTYTKGKLLHEIRERAYKGNSKAILFNPNEIKEINYSVGAHTCNPRGNVKYYDGKLYVLHINKHFSLKYLLGKYKELNNRQSATNRKNRWCIHYAFSEEKLRKYYEDDLKKSINFNELVNNG